ncbi:MAG: zf-TFIIB domain-containing protein [Planctomycetia bacterium]|nr:zf-TFIIB domain-containing protein [Planctomycetia bacterium]
MNCANCGAGLKPVGNRPYFRCPYCETFHFPEELADGVAVVGGEMKLACPICTEPLTHAAIDGHKIGYCQSCRGFLAKNSTFNQIVQLKRARNTSAPVPVPFSPEELKRCIACPSCRKPMDTHPYHAGGNAVIDTCHRCCVVWLDAGELTVLGRYTGRSAPPVRSVNADGSPASPPPPPPVPEPPMIYLFGFPITLDG